MSLIKRFATEDYVATALDEKLLFHSTASVGQTIVVKVIDENGKPTEWEAVDMPDANAPKNEFILNSSTEGSAKKFKLTIDDDGILAATEIVESTV